MYEYTDLVIESMNKRIIAIFDRLKGKLARLDEITAILSAVGDAYTELDTLTRAMLLKTAKKAYRTAGGDDDTIDAIWLDSFLSRYSPVTKYAYITEVERKRSRLFEALAATDCSPKEIKNALRLWAQMAGEYAIEATDEAALTAYRELGVEYVAWISEEDERRCGECAARHLRVYPVDDVPPKPHLNCRCILSPV